MSNASILVKFVQNRVGPRGGVSGFHPSLRAIAFPAKAWKYNRPRAGDEVLCRIDYQSPPDAKSKFILLMPADESINQEAFLPRPATTRRVERRVIPAPARPTRWTVEPDEALGTVKVTRIRTAKDRNQDHVWHVTEARKGMENFPPSVQTKVAMYLLQIAERKQDKAEAVLSAALASVETAPAVSAASAPPLAVSAPPAQVSAVVAPNVVAPCSRLDLRHPRDLLVTEITELSHELSYERVGQQDYIFRVLADGALVGMYDDIARISRLSDFCIKGRKVTLSNGDSFSVYEKQLRVFACERYNRRRVVFDTEAHCNLVGKQVVSWSEASTLAVGDVFAQEYPFQWLGDRLTNGQISLSRTRPEGVGAWKRLGIPSVAAPLWEQFLAGLEGKYLIELLPYHAKVTEKRRESAEHRLTPRQRELNAVITGKLWTGCQGCEQVSLGRNVIMFHVKRANGSDRFVIDNAGPGSMYIFDDRSLAESFAAGEITRTEARGRGYCRVDHVTGWEDEVATMLGATEVSLAA